MELLDNRTYPARDIEKWLADCAGITRGTRQWKRALNYAGETLLGVDTYFFERVSETHYRVHRANAEQVKMIHKVLDEASGVKSLYRSMRIGAVALACLLVILVVTAVGANFR